MIHLKEHFEKEKKADLKINTTRRLMQSLYNHIVENESFVYGLTNLKNYDEYTLNHSVNVCTLAIALGRHLGLDRNELVDLGTSAFFHDVGKTETPLEIINKPGKLTPEEREIVERHPHLGAQRLIQSTEFQHLPVRALNVALEHHIRADQSGYPKAFKRQSANLFSRIVKIVDYFDAITTPRVYRKKAFSRQEALAHMAEKSGTEFDPVIFKVFSNMLGAYPVGTLVALSTGEIGIVFEANPEASQVLRPMVKLITDRSGNRIDGDVVDLTESDPRTSFYLRTILKALDPETYGVRISDYFLAQAQ
jgi:putative nucleotidyltransferase with HDIG domain